jgi:hypothetical protein
VAGVSVCSLLLLVILDRLKIFSVLLSGEKNGGKTVE